ncbi:FAD-binding oxidoreductase [Jeotgalibacillus sp. S-D1]|uniref:NAD(P)/FAD-dependent oxidoreductase n=1 Tax=Jeotgalibacillus sp. S-D1 TaxID=2552189 RepID=UPI00105A4D04|nr:FAD-dependent oxidoreductase [Jeotgalibacillus sp. S-D1]TDL31785.1 FAD-binding oxidoreductase [Jeotgalibacillus sp. S-D1]
MRLHSGSLYWPETKTDEKKTYPALEETITCDVLIIGGGMAGALCAEEFSHTSLKTVLVEKNSIGSGSSSANTGLLQYSNDKMLHEFIEEIGEDKAVQFYKLCLEAIEELQQVTGTLAHPVDFIRRPSLYYASDENDAAKIKKEYDALYKHGFEVEYYDKEKISEVFGFEKPAAIMTHGDAEVNPYLLTHALIETANIRNVEVYENTAVQDAGREEEYHLFKSEKGVIRAKKVIYSTGYETVPFAEKLGAEINRTYAIATNPINELADWTYQALIWETKRPYFYMRTTVDGRIVAGGLDEDKMETPVDEAFIKERGERLLNHIKKHFSLEDLEVSHAWAACFGESNDGLPFIGEHPDKKDVYYCLGFGGNGTVSSKVGAKLLAGLIQGEEADGSEIVRLDR